MSSMFARGMCTVAGTPIACADAVAHAGGFEKLTVTVGVADRRHCLPRKLEALGQVTQPLALVGGPHVVDAVSAQSCAMP
jgi:hypothetical protein